MARQGDKGTPTLGKARSQNSPATVSEFPHSGSQSSSTGAQDFASPGSLLSPNEQALYDELIALARLLDKRRIARVYVHLASVAEQASLFKAQGQNAIPVLARGLDQLKKLQAEGRDKRLKSAREVMANHDGTILCAVLTFLAAIALFLVGLQGDASASYASAFLVALGLALLIPVFWQILTSN